MNYVVQPKRCYLGVKLFLVVLVLLFSASYNFIGAVVFPTCRFHFGTDWTFARDNPALMAQVDYLTGPWIGSAEHFNIGVYYELSRDNNKIPVNHTYIIAFAARRDWGLQDCDVGTPNLCQRGAQYIRQNRQKILDIYANFARGVYQIMGDRPSVWLMEADFTQYTLAEQEGGGLTYAEAGQLMSDIIDVVRQYCPSAVFSLDISPWRLRGWQINWFSHMPMDRVSFIHTSGGRSRADTDFISDSWHTDLPTWRWTYETFGKPILADAGYGVAGVSLGHDDLWDNVGHLTNRINNGVRGVAQVNPRDGWASTIANIRPSLPQPPSCQVTSVRVFEETQTCKAQIFPNPALKGSFGIKFNTTSKTATVAIFDLAGREVYRKLVDIENNLVNINSALDKGVYVVNIKTEDFEVEKQITITE